MAAPLEKFQISEIRHGVSSLYEILNRIQHPVIDLDHTPVDEVLSLYEDQIQRLGDSCHDLDRFDVHKDVKYFLGEIRQVASEGKVRINSQIDRRHTATDRFPFSSSELIQELEFLREEMEPLTKYFMEICDELYGIRRRRIKRSDMVSFWDEAATLTSLHKYQITSLLKILNRIQSPVIELNHTPLREVLSLDEEELPLLAGLCHDLEKCDVHEAVKYLLGEIRKVADEGKVRINSQIDRRLTVTDISIFSSTELIQKLKPLTEDLMEICEDLYGIRFKRVGISSDRSFSKQSGPKMEDTVVGFEDEAMVLTDRLTGMTTEMTKRREVISIAGMAGLGKTTLARKLYNDPFILRHFDTRAWTQVSQVYEERNLLVGILSCIVDLTGEINEMSDEKLSNKLYKQLKGKRYLIVFDDIWDIGAWENLKRCFPDDRNGSRVMFTSRITDEALQVQPGYYVHHLRFLTEDESWELLQQKIFGRKCHNPVKIDIGKQIIKKCHGLPLAIVVLAGVLANERTSTWWMEVAASVSSHIASDPRQYMDTLGLSYDHLPFHLKPCFLYLGLFPEDYQMPVEKLIWLWVAEGFIQETGNKSLEDMAEDYLMELISRSLVVVARKGSIGEIKACCIHDLLRDLCLIKVAEENFSPKIYRYGEVSSWFSSSSPFPNSQLDLHAQPQISSKHSAPFVQSYFCFDVSLISDVLQLVKVLDLSSVPFLSFPSEIVKLVYLKYLELQAEDGTPPASVSNLLYLETLIISSAKNITVPQNIWTMVRLRHLYIRSGQNFLQDPHFEESGMDDIYPSILDNIQTILQVCPSKSCRAVLARTPNIRKLGFCGPLISQQDGDLMLPDLGFLNHLETLKLLNTAPLAYHKEARSSGLIMLCESLKRLTLSSTALGWKEMWTIGMLPNLEVLKLKLHACVGQEWETCDDGFRRLKFLKFQDLDIVQWKASRDHFPILQRLVVHRCQKLEEIPSGLGDIPTLETIEVIGCIYSAEKSAREIQNEQESLGNDYLKIVTNPHGHLPGTGEEQA